MIDMNDIYRWIIRLNFRLDNKLHININLMDTTEESSTITYYVPECSTLYLLWINTIDRKTIFVLYSHC